MTKRIEELISLVLKILIVLAMMGIIFTMGKMILETFRPVFSTSHLDVGPIISQIATFFILLEFVLMLTHYLKDLHDVPVEYLIVIGITAISREIIMEHGNGGKILILACSILILIIVLLVIRKNRLFSEDT